MPAQTPGAAAVAGAAATGPHGLPGAGRAPDLDGVLNRLPDVGNFRALEQGL